MAKRAGLLMEVLIETDGRTVWVNSYNGAIGRLGPQRIDIHNQANNGCLACCNHTGDATAWETFKAGMLEHHGVALPDKYRPAWAKETSCTRTPKTTPSSKA